MQSPYLVDKRTNFLDSKLRLPIRKNKSIVNKIEIYLNLALSYLSQVLYDLTDLNIFILKVLTNDKRCGFKSVGLALSYSRRALHQNLFRPHPVRGLKQLSEPCLCYKNSIIVCKHGINIGLRQFLSLTGKTVYAVLHYNLFNPSNKSQLCSGTRKKIDSVF
jgi:hypothetical protein